MKIRLARTAGFCWGVKRALRIAFRFATQKPRTRKKVHTYGPLIHNQDVVALLTEKGIRPRFRLPYTNNHDILIIRAHGLAPDIQTRLRGKGYKLVDATCPYVKRIQKKVQEFSKKRYDIIICGDKKHAEVAGLMGYAMRQPCLIGSVREAVSLKLRLHHKVCILAQSTFNKTEYQKIIEVIRTKCSAWNISDRTGTPSDGLVILETICRSSAQRQSEVLRMAQEVDALIVIGARHSANTLRLVQIARPSGVPTFHVQNEKELVLKKLSGCYRLVGVTSGTSTPDWLIQRIVNYLKQL